MADEKIDKAVYDSLVIEKDSVINALREELDLSRSGLNDAAGIRAARAEYMAIEVEKDQKKPSIKEWWATLAKEPEKAPRTLRGYLVDEGKAGAGGGRGASEKGTAGTQAGTQDGASALADLQALNQEIQRSGRGATEGQLKRLAELRDVVQGRRP